MEAQAQKIQAIFTNTSLFKIPYFQRQYVWKEDNWKRFWTDLASLVENPHIYFLGSLIAKKDGEALTLIDGQQRSTTLFLLLKALYMRAGKNSMFTTLYYQNGEANDGPILQHNKHDRPIFEEIMNMGNFADPLNSSGKVLDAWMYLSGEVRKLTPEQAKDMQKCIEQYVRFVYISLNEEDDEQQIFDTINSLGVDLTTGELLKNYFFNKENESVYSSLWAPVFERANTDYWSDTLVKGRIKESNIEQFFYALLQIAMCDSKNNVSAETKKSYRLKDQVFANYKHFFRTQGIEHDKDPFIAMTVDYGKLYQSCFSKRVLEQTIKPGPNVKRLALIMYSRQMTSVIPYILYVLYKQSDITEQQRIFGYLEAYLIRRIICGSSTSNYSDLFSENLIGQGIYTYMELKEYIERKSTDASLSMPSDQDIIMHIQTQDLSAKATLLLYMLESMAQGTDITLDGLNCYVSEQLLPVKADASAWPLLQDETESDRKAIALTLGNFVMIAAANKLKAKQHKDWTTLSNALNPICQSVITALHPDTQSVWTPVQIKAQNQTLADIICQYWPQDGIPVVTICTNEVQTEPTLGNATEEEEISLDSIKPLLNFTEEDFIITENVYHTFTETTFEDHLKTAIETSDSLAALASKLNDSYHQQYSGIVALTYHELTEILGEAGAGHLKSEHPLYYIGKCKHGWVVTLDRSHFLRRPSCQTLDTVLTEAAAYCPETITGLWTIMTKDTQLKGILTELDEQKALNLTDYYYKQGVASLIMFCHRLEDNLLSSHPLKAATSFDALRAALASVIEHYSQADYLKNSPCVIRMAYDVINYLEDFYLEHHNIELDFHKTRTTSKARITYLDTGAPAEEMTQRDAIRQLTSRYPQVFKKLMANRNHPLLQNSPMNPGPKYEKLSNGWYLFILPQNQIQGQLVIMANMITDKVSVELL